MARTIGIIEEHKSEWEKRAPLTPDDVELLKELFGFDFIVQPSNHRIFTDDEYLRAGARLDDDLSSCDIVIGIKEFPIETFRRNGTYLFFSHTIKGQEYNMGMLKRLRDLGCTLIDYEMMKDDNGRRLIFFGNYAGLAGMVDSLWALGRRLANEGYETPLGKIKQAWQYTTLSEAKAEITNMGVEMKEWSEPGLMPLICGFAGYGNVSGGAQEIFDLLDPVVITPGQLMELDLTPSVEANNEVNPLSGRFIKVIFKEKDMVEPRDPEAPFDLNDYYTNPNRYRSIFSKFIPRLTILMNGIYWDERYPRLLKKDDVKTFFGESGDNRLKVIGDISCDVNGAIECNEYCTQPDSSVYVFDVDDGTTKEGVRGNGPVILAVDNLPAEFSRESSGFFSNILKDILPEIVLQEKWDKMEYLSLRKELERSIILLKGRFTTDFEYMKDYIDPSN